MGGWEDFFPFCIHFLETSGKVGWKERSVPLMGAFLGLGSGSPSMSKGDKPHRSVNCFSVYLSGPRGHSVPERRHVQAPGL